MSRVSRRSREAPYRMLMSCLPGAAAVMLFGTSASMCWGQGLPTYRIDLLARDGSTPLGVSSGWVLAAKSPGLDDDGTAAASLVRNADQITAMWIGEATGGAVVASQASVTLTGDITLRGPVLATEPASGLGVSVRSRDGTLLRQAVLGGPLDVPGSLTRRPRFDSQLRLGVTTRSSSANGFLPMWLMESVTTGGAVQQVPLLIADASMPQLHPATFTDVANPAIAPAGSSMFTGVVTSNTGQRRVMRSVRSISNTTAVSTLLTSGVPQGFEVISTASDAAATGHVALAARLGGIWQMIRLEPAGGTMTIARFDGLGSALSLPVTSSYENVTPTINEQGRVAFVTQASAQHPARLMVGDGAALAEVVRDGQTLATQQGPITIGVGAASQRIAFLAPPVMNAQGQIAFVARLSDLSGALLLATPVANACPADLGSQGGAAGGDFVLDNNDFIVFIDAFFQNDASADLGSEGGDRSGDGIFDNNDFIVFVQLFFEGC